MKKLIIILSLFGTFVCQVEAQRAIRPYIRTGVTMAAPTMEELDYTPGWEEFMTRKMNTKNLGFGVQVTFPLKSLDLGFDVGYSTLFDLSVTEDPTTYLSDHQDSEQTAYFILVGEKKLPNGVFLQCGIGPHLVSWQYTYTFTDFDFPSLNTKNEYGGTDLYLGLEFGIGYELFLSDNFGLFAMGKVDVITEYGIVAPVTLNFGVRF